MASSLIITLTLTIDDLIDIIDLLKKCRFPEKRWIDLGLRLGLHKNTLDTIERNYPGDVSRCLTECLSQWLCRADNVNSRGGATWDSMSDALRSMNEIAVADKLDQEKRPHLNSVAIDIFNAHHPNLSKSLSDPVHVASMLQKEGVIKDHVLNNVESASPFVSKQREVLLASLQEAVQAKYSSLQVFASVLDKFTSNVQLGKAIHQDYDKVFDQNSYQVTWERQQHDIGDTPSPPMMASNTMGTVQDLEILIPIPRSMSSEFSAVRKAFTKMFSKVRSAVTRCNPPIEEIKVFLGDYASDLEDKLEGITTLRGILSVIKKNCTLVDFSILEAVVEEFEISEAQRHIDDYRREMEESCRSLSVSLCCNERFEAVRGSPSLQCETATYVFDWEPEEHTLKDVKDVLSKSSGKLVKIKYINKGNSIVVTCSFPHSLTGAVVISMIKNLDMLIKNGLMKLTVGYCTIKEQPRDEEEETKDQLHDIQEEPVTEPEEKIKALMVPHSGISGDLEILPLDTNVAIIQETNKQLEEKLRRMREQHWSLLTKASSAFNQVLRGMRMEIEQERFSLKTNEAGILDQSVALLENKGEIEKLQEQALSMSMQVLMKKEENKKYEDVIRELKEQINETPSSQPVKLTRQNTIGQIGTEVSLSELKKQINETPSSQHVKLTRQNVIGQIGAEVSLSELGSYALQFQFVMEQQKVSLPILQKIKDDSCSNDDKASLFLKAINDDPILVAALKKDERQHERGVNGSVDWYRESVRLYSPSPVDCEKVISKLKNNHKRIELHYSSTHSTVVLLSSPKLYTLTLRILEIHNTPLPHDCIQYLCQLLTNNKSIQVLDIWSDSVSDRGVADICKVLEHNSTITSLDLTYNALITSASAQALSHLLLNNSTLSELNLSGTSLSSESLLLLLQSLSANKNMKRLILDHRHKETCINTYPNYHLIQDRVEWD